MEQSTSSGRGTRRALRFGMVLTALSSLRMAAGCSDDSGSTGGVSDLTSRCEGLRAPEITRAKILPAEGEDAYAVELEWAAANAAASDRVTAKVATRPDGAPWTAAMDPVGARTGKGIARVDKLAEDIFLELEVEREGSGACAASTAVRLAKPDYRDPARWGEGWIRVVSHVHSIADEKKDAGGDVHANRINWFNGCFLERGEDAACHDLLLRSFGEPGLEWIMAAAKDKGIGAVIVTDHDNVGLWFTDTFRKYDRADADGPSVVRGLEWTSALGHLTVVGNFLPQIPADADVFDLRTAHDIHTSTPLPPDSCDDTDENHDIGAPAWDGPDAPCARSDHRGHGDDPISIAEAKASIEALEAAGALVFANHPTNESHIEPPMMWQLDNLDLLHGVEIGTPDPVLTNRDAPEYWQSKGLSQGRRWVGIAGTDCHVNSGPYDGDTGCSSFHGLVDLTHFDAPYMWVAPLGSTSREAPNAPDLVVAALREGRVAVVQDVDPAVIVDLGIDTNGDGLLDYWSGSTVPTCEQPARSSFPLEVRIKPIQTHDYNVSVWSNGQEIKILQDQQLEAGKVWVRKTEIQRNAVLPANADLGYVMVQVRENKTAAPDDDAGFANPIWFARPDPDATPCDTRDAEGR